MTPALSAPILLLQITVAASAAERQEASRILFESRIRPVVVAHCYQCHGTGKEMKGGLRLVTLEGWAKGGDSGPLVEPGKPDQSLLIEVLRHNGPIKMPPTGKLPQSIIDDFERWIRLGAAVPRDGPNLDRARHARTDIAAGRRHWAYRVPGNCAAPRVKDATWPQTEIDAFVLSRVEAAGLRPVADADRETLVRRLYFDLVGLPPTPKQIDEFLADHSAGAWERLVDRLLASPQFGERWGRHWLDVVRFAESLTLRGFVLKEAWRYRDYVIEAFDSDLPYDEFLREQIAGDLMARGSFDLGEEVLALRDAENERAESAQTSDGATAHHSEAGPVPLPAAQRSSENSLKIRQRRLIATTVLMLGNANLEEQDKRQLEMDVVDDQLDLIGRGFLAQTITCARCHDHKFDPIPTRDYYALAGILKNAKTLEHANISKWIEVPLPQTPEQDAVWERREKQLNVLRTRLAQKRHDLDRIKKAAKDLPASTAQANRLRDEIQRLDVELQTRLRGPRRPRVMTVIEQPIPADVRVHIRGSVHQLGALVPRGFLQIATSGEAPRIPPDSGGRLQLAEWLVDRGNPLTARVLANRVWHWLFGNGLVRTTDNFGTTGEAPSNPELLDDLAIKFVEDGWSIKRLIRRIVLSRTYRLSDDEDACARRVDPENRLFSHRNRRRLDAECLRDAMLQISGVLRSDRGGPGYPADLTADFGYVDKSVRRSVYVPVFRNALPAIFEDFDFANPSLVTGRRTTSTVAPQALFLMNDPFVLEQSRRASTRLLGEKHVDNGARLTAAFRLVLGRRPTPQERKIAVDFLASATLSDAGGRRDAWSQLIQSLFATIQFRYVD